MIRKIIEKIRLSPKKRREPYLSFYKILGFKPKNIEYYQQALLHKSVSKEDKNGNLSNNERLEFLGDAILDAIVADIVFQKFGNKDEGFLTNTRSKIVQRESLNRIAVDLGLDKMIRTAANAKAHKNHIYGNALEAFIGAIYLDRGFNAAKIFIEQKIIENLNIEKIAKKEVNFKSKLIEWSQKYKISLTFELIESFTDGDNNPVFQTKAILGDIPVGIGIGHSKKESQQNAAKMSLKKIRSDKELVERLKAQKKEVIQEEEQIQEPETAEEQIIESQPETDEITIDFSEPENVESEEL